jgi:hypothetical protein
MRDVSPSHPSAADAIEALESYPDPELVPDDGAENYPDPEQDTQPAQQEERF